MPAKVWAQLFLYTHIVFSHFGTVFQGLKFGCIVHDTKPKVFTKPSWVWLNSVILGQFIMIKHELRTANEV